MQSRNIQRTEYTQGMSRSTALQTNRLALESKDDYVKISDTAVA